MAKAKKVLSTVLVALFTVFTVLSYVPAQTTKAAAGPKVQIVAQPNAEYKVGDRVLVKFNSPNYKGIVQYRAFLWNRTTQKFVQEIYKSYPGYWYKPVCIGPSVFTIDVFYPQEPGTYYIGILVKAKGAKTYSSYVYTSTFTVKAKEEAAIKEFAPVADVTVDEGAVATLPATVKATLTDGTTKDVAVKWDAVDTTKVGTVKVEGTVEGTTLKPAVNVTVKEVALKVESVSAINLKQVKVTFNKVVDKTEAEKVANYKVYNANSTTDLVGAGSAKVQEDGKTVIITLATALNNGTTAKVTVSNFVTYTNDSVAVVDVTIPTVVGLQVTGPNTVTVEYSEPVTNLNTAEYVIDDGNYIVSNAVANGSNKVDVTVGVNFTNGEHKIKFNGSNVTDYAGYKVISTTKTFTVAADTTLPTVSVKSATPTEVRLVFSKPVTNVNNSNVLYRHTYNSNIYQYDGDDTITGGANFVTVISSTEIKLDFTDKPIPLGNNKIYIAYASSTGTKIQDLWGNKLEAVALDVNISIDLTKPAVKEVKFIDAQTLKVIFTKTLDTTTAQTAANYVVKDSSGKVIAVSSAVLGGTDNNEVTLNFAANALGGGSYSIEIKNVKDTSLVKNVMDAYTTTLNVNDTVKPTVGTGKYVIDNSGTTKKITVYIPFSEEMDPATLTKANFMRKINGAASYVALGDDDTITVSPDRKAVTIVSYNGSTNWTSIGILVGAVRDLAGNGLATFTAEPTISADSIAVEKVEAIGRKQIKVTYDGRLSSITATGYSLVEETTGNTSVVNALSVASHTVNADRKSEVVFNLANNLAYDVTSSTNKIQLKVASATGTKSFLGSVVTDTTLVTDNTVVASTVLDKIAPELTSVTVDSATQITLVFTEKLKAATFAATLNGFSVKGANAKLTSVAIQGGTDSTTVILTGTGFDSNTTVSYNNVAGITDVNGNALASFVDQGE